MKKFLVYKLKLKTEDGTLFLLKRNEGGHLTICGNGKKKKVNVFVVVIHPFVVIFAKDVFNLRKRAGAVRQYSEEMMNGLEGSQQEGNLRVGKRIIY